MAQTLEGLFREADGDGDGKIGSQDAATFFARTGLPATTLQAIWLASTGRGAVDHLGLEGFQLAIRLVSLLQKGAPLDPGTLDMAQSTQPVAMPSLTPALAPSPSAASPHPLPPSSSAAAALPGGVGAVGGAGGIGGIGAGGGGLPAYDWSISEEFRHRNSVIFQNITGGLSGRMPAAKAVELLQKSGLPTATLALIWELADASHVGQLSLLEYFAAVKLAEAVACAHIPVPSSLPPALQEALSHYSSPSPLAGSPFISAASQPPHSAAAAVAVSSLPFAAPAPGAGSGVGTGAGGGSGGAQLSPHERAAYMAKAAEFLRGSTQMEASEAFHLFSKSGLSREQLHQIWVLSDRNQDGKLSPEELCTALYLIDCQLGRVSSPSASSSPSSAATSATSPVSASAFPSSQQQQQQLNEMAQMKAQLASFSKEGTSLTSQHQEGVATFKQLQEEHDKLRDQLNQAEKACNEKRTKLAEIQQQVQAMQASLLQERQRLGALQESIKALDAELNQSSGFQSQIQSELLASSQMTQNLIAQRDLLQQQIQQQTLQIRTNDEQIQALEAFIKTQREMSANYQSMITSQNQQIEMLSATAHHPPQHQQHAFPSSPGPASSSFGSLPVVPSSITSSASSLPGTSPFPSEFPTTADFAVSSPFPPPSSSAASPQVFDLLGIASDVAAVTANTPFGPDTHDPHHAHQAPNPPARHHEPDHAHSPANFASGAGAPSTTAGAPSPTSAVAASTKETSDHHTLHKKHSKGFFSFSSKKDKSKKGDKSDLTGGHGSSSSLPLPAASPVAGSSPSSSSSTGGQSSTAPPHSSASSHSLSTSSSKSKAKKESKLKIKKGKKDKSSSKHKPVDQDPDPSPPRSNPGSLSPRPQSTLSPATGATSLPTEDLAATLALPPISSTTTSPLPPSSPSSAPSLPAFGASNPGGNSLGFGLDSLLAPAASGGSPFVTHPDPLPAASASPFPATSGGNPFGDVATSAAGVGATGDLFSAAGAADLPATAAFGNPFDTATAPPPSSPFGNPFDAANLFS